MELERFVRLEWPRTENESQFSFCQSHSDHRSQYQHAVWHTFLRRSARSTLSHSTMFYLMFYMRKHLRRFGFKLRLRKGAQNTHMVAER